MKKVEYIGNGGIIIDGVEWEITGLKQVCYHDFVYEGSNRGVICRKHGIPRELLNEWIEKEDWVFDKKDHWQRPYSYRIDDTVKRLISEVCKLTEIQEEVDTIEFKSENLISRVKINIEFKSNNEFKSYKTFVIEKYVVGVEGYDEFTGGKIEYKDEIRYKCKVGEGEILVQHAKIQKDKH